MFRWRWIFAQHRRQVKRVLSVEPIGSGICAAPYEHTRNAEIGKVSLQERF
jgi:hypothetical protein